MVEQLSFKLDYDSSGPLVRLTVRLTIDGYDRWGPHIFKRQSSPYKKIKAIGSMYYSLKSNQVLAKKSNPVP